MDNPASRLSQTDSGQNHQPTLQGLVAILLWAALASLTAIAGPIPPFQLAAMAFALGTISGLGYAAVTKQPLRALLSLPARALAIGVAGLLGYHVCYFYALQQAPPLQANLINYLWPLLIVLFSGLLPAHVGGRELRWWHVAGALLGFAGAALVLARGRNELAFSGAAGGYAAAAAAAVIWAAYSVASRLLHAVPSTAVIAACAATSLAAALIHVFAESTTWPDGSSSWLAVLAMGAGPVGLAFYLWDAGMKRGDLRLLGVLSYATPLLSTGLLTVLGLGEPTPMIWIAALLVTAGALLAAADTLKRGLSKK